MNNISIVFIGAGPVAAKSLRQIGSKFNVEAVITKKKADHHKDEPPVSLEAKNMGATIFEANTKKELDYIIEKNKFSSELAVLIDFGVIVSEGAINSFPRGIINSHFSLLPEWRGADPITFSILSGQSKTGVSLMLLNTGMDEGPILDQRTIDISPSDTGLTLTDKLINLSSEMLTDDIPRYLSGDINPISQIDYSKNKGLDFNPSYSHKLTKLDGKVDWTKPAEVIEREIRAFQPWPKSYSSLGNDLTVTLLEASIESSLMLKPGQIKTDKNSLFIGTSTNALSIKNLQPAGKKNMTSAEFLRGYLNKLIVQ